MNNILKNGDDPTVNQGDQRQYRLERERKGKRGETERVEQPILFGFPIVFSICCCHRIELLSIEFEVIWRSFGHGFNPGK